MRCVWHDSFMCVTQYIPVWHTWRSPVTHRNIMSNTHQRVMPHTWKSHATHMKESCHTHYLCVHARRRMSFSLHEHIHTHTHIYIYIYIQCLPLRAGKKVDNLPFVRVAVERSQPSTATRINATISYRYVSRTSKIHVSTTSKTCVSSWQRSTTLRGYSRKWNNILRIYIFVYTGRYYEDIYTYICTWNPARACEWGGLFRDAYIYTHTIPVCIYICRWGGLLREACLHIYHYIHNTCPCVRARRGMSFHLRE